MDMNLDEARYQCVQTLLGMYKRANAGHIGASLSCLEILVDLCFRRMSGEDRVILSKGHAAACLYTVLAKSKRISEEELETFYKDGTRLAAHPPTNGEIEHIPFGTGSLGHGLSLAAGLAFADRFTGKKRTIYCVLSDGECNEGSTWEAALFAQQNRLSNLTVVVDANGLQGFGSTKDVMNLEPFADKWKCFGFEVVEIQNGNCFNDISNAYAKASLNNEKPKCIIARTQKGHGVSYMQNKMEWHYLPMSDEQYSLALSDSQKLFESRKNA